MPTYAYALKPDGPRELELDVSMKDVVVKLKGKEVTRFGAEHLQHGTEVKLADGTVLKVQRKAVPPAIVVTKDGVPLLGGGPDPEAVLEQVWKQTAGWAVGYAIWGAVTVFRADAHSLEPQSYAAFGVAALLAVLAVLTKRRWYPAIMLTAIVFTGYIAYWAANGGSLCFAIGLMIFPLWFLWAWWLITRSAPRAGAASAP